MLRKVCLRISLQFHPHTFATVIASHLKFRTFDSKFTLNKNYCSYRSKAVSFQQYATSNTQVSVQHKLLNEQCKKLVMSKHRRKKEKQEKVKKAEKYHKSKLCKHRKSSKSNKLGKIISSTSSRTCKIKRTAKKHKKAHKTRKMQHSSHRRTCTARTTTGRKSSHVQKETSLEFINANATDDDIVILKEIVKDTRKQTSSACAVVCNEIVAQTSYMHHGTVELNSHTPNTDSTCDAAQKTTLSMLMVQTTEETTVCQQELKRTRAVLQQKIQSIVNSSRIWEESKYSHWFHKYGSHISGTHISVMSYNLLAQNLLEDNKYLYTHCDPDFLSWEYRKNNLLNEIKNHRPNVICLQEVEDSQFTEFWLPSFKLSGYEGLYKKRNGDKSDGCAIFYDIKILQLLKYVPVDYYKPGIPLMNRDNVAQVALFSPVNSTKAKVCVANTHLLFNPKRGDIKLVQAVNLLAAVNQVTGEVPCPVILCGDFNSKPHSYMYRLISAGILNYAGLSADVISGQREVNFSRNIIDYNLLSPNMNLTEGCTFYFDETKNLERVNHETGNTSSTPSTQIEKVVADAIDAAISQLSFQSNANFSCTLHHNFPFISVYDHMVHHHRGYAEVSTHHTRACCTLDYMFYTVANKRSVVAPSGEVVHGEVMDNKLHVMRRYRLMSDIEIMNCGGLPNAHQSSDHIPLIAHFFLED